MTVYVDQFGEGWGRWTGGGHMLGSDLDELHAMAAYLGLRLAWFQDKTFAHYDLVRSKRDKALAAGAVAIDLFDDKMPDDVLMKNGDGTYETYAQRMSRRKMSIVNASKGVYSNFFVEPDGTCVEMEYQAAKHQGHPWRQITILRASSPKRAKKLGRKWKLSRYQLMEWNNRKKTVMTALVRKKMEDHPDIAFTLAASDGEIVEKNWWHDNYWGDCSCLQCYHVGENHLGKIWMMLRDELAEIAE
jgi:hypothetical protein